MVSTLSIAALTGRQMFARICGSYRIVIEAQQNSGRRSPQRFPYRSLHGTNRVAAAWLLFVSLGSLLQAEDGERSGLWQLTVSPTVTFQAETAFSGFGGIAATGAPPAATGGPTFGVYDDGFVLADISGDTSLTSNWSYTNDAQYDASGGGSIGLSTTTSVGVTGVTEEDASAPGVEIRFTRRLPGLSQGRMHWGLEIALGYSSFEMENSATLLADGNRVTDAFPLDGVIPPLAPYTGSFTGPGPLLGTTPVRSTSPIAGAATINGQRRLEADLFTVRLGPRVDAQLTEALALYLSGGVAVAYADGSYRFNSTVTYDGGTVIRSGAASESEFLGGFFVEAGATWRFTDSWSFFGSIQHRALEDFSLSAAGTDAELSFDDSFTLSGGLSYRF